MMVAHQQSTLMHVSTKLHNVYIKKKKVGFSVHCDYLNGSKFLSPLNKRVTS